MAVRVNPAVASSTARIWQPPAAPGFGAMVWRIVLNVVQTMWAE